MAKISDIMIRAVSSMINGLDKSEYPKNTRMEIFTVHVLAQTYDTEENYYYIGEVYLNQDRLYEVSFYPTEKYTHMEEVTHPLRLINNNENPDFIVILSDHMRIRETKTRKGFNDNVDLFENPITMSIYHWKIE